MATIKNFEELDSWKKARELAGYVYQLMRKEGFSRDFGLRDQIQRAASSVMHNIAEGFEAGYNTEFVRFLKMARRSAGEVQSQLYLALDAGYITDEEIRKAYDLSVETKKLINGLITYLSKHR
ncbi:MAG: four helix bundle protein [Anaerolineales bacterium]|jgi:four helix bundle protein|nr:four helix bundle protein [Anaerolineales bacterium]MDX9936491.1 four helix bundle protein [Anaerolineales bacterium]GER80311.1 four helix bundle protein [Candidatus Denitrolinea symbiosum]